MIYLDRTKIDLGQVFNTLKANNYKRTSSRRYYRFEDKLSGYRNGVEITASDTIIELCNYCDYYAPQSTLKNIDDNMKTLFGAYVIDYERGF